MRSFGAKFVNQENKSRLEACRAFKERDLVLLTRFPISVNNQDSRISHHIKYSQLIGKLYSKIHSKKIISFI